MLRNVPAAAAAIDVLCVCVGFGACIEHRSAAVYVGDTIKDFYNSHSCVQQQARAVLFLTCMCMCWTHEVYVLFVGQRKTFIIFLTVCATHFGLPGRVNGMQFVGVSYGFDDLVRGSRFFRCANVGFLGVAEGG